MRRSESFLGLVAAAAVLLLMLLLPRVGHTADLLVLPNNGGGEIVLTSRRCELAGLRYNNLRAAYSRGDDGAAVDGCWAFMDGVYHVIWVGRYGQPLRRIYSVEGWEVRRVPDANGVAR